MKRLVLLIVISALGSGWRTADAFAPFPVNVKGPQLMEAVEESNPKLLKSLLFHRQELPKKEKAHLLKKAKEIAQERKKSISWYRSFWDVGHCVIGGCLAYCYLTGTDILGNTPEYTSASHILRETSLEEIRESLTNADVKREVRTALKDADASLEARKYSSGKPEVSGIFHRLSMKNSLKQAEKKQAEEAAKKAAAKANQPVPVMVPQKIPNLPFNNKDDEKAFKKYSKWHNSLSGQRIGLFLLGGVDTLLGWAGIYYFARGWFCMSAKDAYVQAQHIVNILEKVPVIEERLI